MLKLFVVTCPVTESNELAKKKKKYIYIYIYIYIFSQHFKAKYLLKIKTAN